MPSPKTNDNFTKIDAEGNSEDEAPTPPPEEELQIPAPILKDLPQKAKEERHHIFEPPPQPPSREVSMMATAAQPTNAEKLKTLFFGCFLCCRPTGNIRSQMEESNVNTGKGMKYEIRG
jgi:hypothetical protein